MFVRYFREATATNIRTKKHATPRMAPVLHGTSFYLTAPTEHTVYTMSHGICHPVDPKKATAVFTDGTLKIEAPFRKPLSPLFDVPIQ